MRFLAFIFVIIQFSCHNGNGISERIDYTGFKEKEIIIVGINKDIELKDTLAVMNIRIPLRLDTFYQWHNTSDCLSCGRIQYRFSDSRYQQFAESGFFWTYKPDSIYQLTVKHNPIKETPDSVQLRPIRISDTIWTSKTILNETTWCNDGNFFIKELKLINGRPFILTAFTSSCSRITDSTSLFYCATTILKNRELNFVAESCAKDTTGFIENIYKAFLSIQIKER